MAIESDIEYEEKVNKMIAELRAVGTSEKEIGRMVNEGREHRHLLKTIG